MANQS